MKTARPLLLTWSPAGLASGANGRRYMIESSSNHGRYHRVHCKLEGYKHWSPWKTGHNRLLGAKREAERYEFDAVKKEGASK